MDGSVMVLAWLDVRKGTVMTCFLDRKPLSRRNLNQYVEKRGDGKAGDNRAYTKCGSACRDFRQCLRQWRARCTSDKC